MYTGIKRMDERQGLKNMVDKEGGVYDMSFIGCKLQASITLESEGLYLLAIDGHWFKDVFPWEQVIDLLSAMNMEYVNEYGYIGKK